MTDTRLLTIADFLFRGNQNPASPAIECPGLRPLTYGGLRRQVRSTVSAFNAMGFHRNDRIAVITPPGPETAVMMIAVSSGFSLVPLNPQSRAQEFGTCFSRMGVCGVVLQDGYADVAGGVAASRNIPVIRMVPQKDRAGVFSIEPACDGDLPEPEFAGASDIANVLLTSGTTGTPKIVLRQQGKNGEIRERQTRILKIAPSDRCLHILPYYHGAGLGLSLMGMIYAGGTVICTREFIPSDFLPLVREYQPTISIAVPAFYQAILRELRKAKDAPLKENALRLIITASSSLPPGVADDLESFLGAPVVEMYASSEAGTISINFPPRRGSVGLPVIENLAILDDDGTRLGPYGRGEIVVEGETVCDGDRESSGEIGQSPAGGWFRTGDLGYLDDEGYLFLTGRKKEVINKGGEKISPEEIDAAIKSHPAVVDAMAFGIPDPILGEEIAAAVVTADTGITRRELRQFLLDRLLPSRVSREIFFTDAIPRNPMGKPMRDQGTGKYSRTIRSEALSRAGRNEHQ